MSAHFSVRPVLDKRRKKKDDTYPIKIRVIVYGLTINFKTRYSSNQKDWDDGTFCRKSSGINYKAINHSLKNEALKIEERLISLMKKNVIQSHLTVAEVKGLLTNNKSCGTIAYFEQHIKSLNDANKVGTARWYNQAKTAITKFRKNEFPLEEISVDWLNRFSQWYLSKNKSTNSINGLSVYLRAIRAIINKARIDGTIDSSHNPFVHFKIKTQKTEKRAISKTDFEKIIQTECEEGWQQRAKDIFFFLYLSYGMPFRDMAHLKLKHIKGNRIEYRRVKTIEKGELISIGMTDSIKLIIEPYLKGKAADDYIFNIIRNDQTPKQQYYGIKNAMKRCNTALKVIAEKSGVIEKLTTYTARHSFASHLLENGNSIELISQMMGHQNIRTTQV